MSLRAIVWVLDHSEATLGARLVLLVLAEYAHDDGTEAFPMVETIAEKARMSRKGVQDCLRRLERNGEIIQTGTRPSGTRIYTVVGVAEGAKILRPGGEDDGAAGAKMTASRGEATTPDPSRPKDKDPNTLSLLREAWSGMSPPLIAHRQTYLEARGTTTALQNALRVYPADVIRQAFENYAICLADENYRWSYRWTLVDFLKRGLDRFVPEAEPLKNFRAPGRLREVSDDDFSDLDEPRGYGQTG